MKKKIFKAVICTILAVSSVMANGAFADISGPATINYQVRISNPNGAVATYEDDKSFIIPYDMVINVNSIYLENDGTEYISTSNCKEGVSSCRVKASDTVYFDQEINPDQYRHDNAQLHYVFRSGAVLRKGPTIYAEEIPGSEIPIGTIISSNYGNGVYEYVEYNGVSGWLYVGHFGWGNKPSSVAEFVSEQFFVAATTAVYAEPDSDEIIGSLEKNIVVNAIYLYYNAPFDRVYYFDNGNLAGWVKNYEGTKTLATIGTSEIMTIGDAQIHAEINKDSTVVVTIPAATKLSSNYFVSNRYCRGGCYKFVSYNGQSGWVAMEYMDDKIVEKRNTPFEYTFTNEIELYDVPNGNKTGTILPAGTWKTYYDYYNQANSASWAFIEDQAGSGWCLTDETERKETEEEKKWQEEDELIDELTAANIYKDTGSTGTGMTPEQAILLCVVLAVLLGASIAALITCIQKRKNKSSDESEGETEESKKDEKKDDGDEKNEESKEGNKKDDAETEGSKENTEEPKDDSLETKKEE